MCIDKVRVKCLSATTIFLNGSENLFQKKLELFHFATPSSSHLFLLLHLTATPDFAGQNHQLLGLQHDFWEIVSGKMLAKELQHSEHKNKQFPNTRKRISLVV